jgi:hypothetical protein
MTTKLLIIAALSAAGVVATTHTAKADDCFEVGWKDKAGAWTYYRAFVDSEAGDHINMHYEYKHGQLEMKMFDKEKASGADVTVFKGRWFEGKDATREGKVRMELEKGHHRAKGWYTYGDNETSPHYDFVLRDCKH